MVCFNQILGKRSLHVPALLFPWFGILAAGLNG